MLLVGSLAGCEATSGLRGLTDAYHRVWAEDGTQDASYRLDKNFKYLRAQVGQRDVFLVLGYVDDAPDGPVEVWYSGAGDVLRLRDGRLMGATVDTGPDWLSVSFVNLPRWQDIEALQSFERTRDVSPGYRYGIREKMLIQRISPPGDTRLRSIPPASLTWFAERAEDADSLPATRYGVDMSASLPRVVYAELCLSGELCFSWQHWPPTQEGAH